MYPDLGLTISNKGSDYNLTFDWVGMEVLQCNVNPSLEIYKNGDNAASVVYRESKTYANNGSLQFAIGPGQGGYYGFRYEEGSHGLGDCYQWVWSGFPRASKS
jgi:hypothetical protein